METPRSTQRLEDQLLTYFTQYLEPSSDVAELLYHALAFASVDSKSRQVVVNRSAILLGMLRFSGVSREPSHGGMASWFSEWLASRLTGALPKRLGDAETPGRVLLTAIAQNFEAVPSSSVRDVLPAAVKYARDTGKNRRAGLDHLFAAILTDPHHMFEIGAFKLVLDETGRAELGRHLLDRLEAANRSGENLNAWRKIFSTIGVASSPAPAPAGPSLPEPDVRTEAPPDSATANSPGDAPSLDPSAPAAKGSDPLPRTDSDTVPPDSPPPRTPAPALLVGGFFADRADEDPAEDDDRKVEEDDPLATGPDVRAMAHLICHDQARPPISIGIFGGWGSGKSTFMEQLQREVRRVSRPTSQDAGQTGPKFVSPIVQIRFNAWQFADANLWASLTAEFFDQLRAGGFQGKGRRIHAKLIEDVNVHVRGLSREATKSRAALTQADQKVREARAEHAEALQVKNREVRQALVSALVDAYQRNRGALVRLGLLPHEASEELPRFVEIAREANSQWGQAKLIGRTLRSHWMLVAGAVLLLGAAAVAAYWIWGSLGALAAAVAGFLPLAAGILRTSRALIEQLSPLAAKLREADESGLNAVLEKELALRSAEDEAEALRETAERADRALARYIDPNARSNPPRLLRYLLEDDPETKAFEQEIGLMGRARRLFEALDKIVEDHRKVAEEAAKKAEEAPKPPDGATDSPEAVPPEQEKDGAAAPASEAENIPARIILYIDDLDRCTHRQVYKVLQAVHLLLAFRLFVVIVAVDVKWVEGAIEKFLEIAADDPAATPDAKERRARAIEYLSKIFQLPFWLKPLSGKDDGRFAAYIETLTGSGAVPAPPPPPSPPSKKGRAARAAGKEKFEPAGAVDPSAGGDATTGGKGEVDTQAAKTQTVESALKTLQLDAREVTFLGSPEIAAIAASDPRGVKRLVNVYKIARSRLSEIDDGVILGDDAQAPAYPLIALMAAIETGQAHEVANDFYDTLKLDVHAEEMLSERLAGRSDALDDAISAVIKERNRQDATIAELLDVARVVRRYSFNKYH